VWELCGLVQVVFLIRIMEFEVEKLGADPIVAPNVLLIVVEALPIAAALVNLLWGEVADGAASH
jgi:hypothetical protein